MKKISKDQAIRVFQSACAELDRQRADLMHIAESPAWDEKSNRGVYSDVFLAAAEEMQQAAAQLYALAQDFRGGE